MEILLDILLCWCNDKSSVSEQFKWVSNQGKEQTTFDYNVTFKLNGILLQNGHLERTFLQMAVYAVYSSSHCNGDWEIKCGYVGLKEI